MLKMLRIAKHSRSRHSRHDLISKRDRRRSSTLRSIQPIDHPTECSRIASLVEAIDIVSQLLPRWFTSCWITDAISTFSKFFPRVEIIENCYSGDFRKRTGRESYNVVAMLSRRWLEIYTACTHLILLNTRFA